jgi:hypothetical protein
MRGSTVNISGDMQQSYQYTVSVTGVDGEGGIVYGGKEYKSGDVIDASQFFNVEDVTAITIAGYIAEVSLDTKSNVITVVYKKIEGYRQITSLNELNNDAAYHIKAKSGEGYLAWNADISNTYVSLRGATNNSFQGWPTNSAVAAIYQQEVTPFDTTVVWQILKEGDSYYLYQPAFQHYVTRTDRDYVFTPNKTALDKIRDNGDGTFSIHAGGGYSESSIYFACICTKENPQAVRNWTWDDHGSVFYFIENPNIELEDILFTSIDQAPAVSEQTAPRGIYTIAGQRLVTLPKEGFVIVDGKKKIIRRK